MTAEMTAENGQILEALSDDFTVYRIPNDTWMYRLYPRLVDDVAPNNALLLAHDSFPES